MSDLQATVDRTRLRFEEAIAAFGMRRRLAGTARWDDLRSEEHYRAFAVAGAMKADLLADLREAVRRAVEGGVSIDTFRKEFWDVVRKHGWRGWTGDESEGGRAWRTRVIYTTNLRKSYAAGRHAQMTDPDFVAAYPYWRWVHSGLANEPRAQHLVWNGMTLHHSDPFWRSYYPPRIPPDWGCTCTVMPVAAPAEGEKTTPPEGWQEQVNPGAGSPPQFVSDSIRFMVDQKAQKLPVPEGDALRAAVAAYQAARQATVTAPPQTMVQFARSTQDIKGRQIVMHAGPLRAIDVAAHAGLKADLSGYTISLDNSAVRHTLSRHGRPKEEADRGQIAITEDDFGVLERVVNAPDAVTHDGKNKSGRDVILFDKVIDGVGYRVAMEVQTNRRVLAMTSMRKKRGAWQ